MKTIAVVTVPMEFSGNIDIYDKVVSSIKETLSDYSVLVHGSQEAKEINIKFYSPELQQGLKNENCGIRTSVVIDPDKMMQSINRLNRRNR